MTTRRVLTREHLTNANIAMWNRLGWPKGINLQIREAADPKEAFSRRERVFKMISGFKDEKPIWFYISAPMKRGLGNWNKVHLGILYWRDVKKDTDRRFKWRRGRTFVIHSRQAELWLVGISRLLKEVRKPLDLTIKGRVVYIIPDIVNNTYVYCYIRKVFNRDVVFGFREYYVNQNKIKVYTGRKFVISAKKEEFLISLKRLLNSLIRARKIK